MVLSLEALNTRDFSWYVPQLIWRKTNTRQCLLSNQIIACEQACTGCTQSRHVQHVHRAGKYSMYRDSHTGLARHMTVLCTDGEMDRQTHKHVSCTRLLTLTFSVLKYILCTLGKVSCLEYGHYQYVDTETHTSTVHCTRRQTL